MKILIKQVKVIDPFSPFNGQITDLFIENGIIRKAGSGLSEQADQEINTGGLHVSPGWFDVFANFGEPGYEFKETLVSGANAAAAGGYTDVMIVSNTNPVLHNRANVEYGALDAAHCQCNRAERHDKSPSKIRDRLARRRQSHGTTHASDGVTFRGAAVPLTS